jgi:flagellar protein FlgJ
MNQDQFLKTAYPAALKVQQKYGLPALALVAQSALETGNGSTIVGNMYFGIKAGSTWTGKKQLLWTHEYINDVYIRIQDWFRAYNNADESFEDYAKLIISNSRYKQAVLQTDANEYIREIANAGYATDPNYANKIIDIIDSLKKKLKI